MNTHELNINTKKQWDEKIIHFPNWIQNLVNSEFLWVQKDKSISFCIYNLLIIEMRNESFFQNNPVMNIYANGDFVSNLCIPQNSDSVILWNNQKLSEESIKSIEIKEKFSKTNRTKWDLLDILFENYSMFLRDLQKKLLSQNPWLYFENAIATTKSKPQSKEKPKDTLEEIEKLLKNKDLDWIKKLLKN